LVRVGEVLEGLPAQAAGLRADDAILRIDDKPIRSFTEIPPLVAAAAGKEMTLTVWRDREVLQMSMTPRDKGEGPRLGIVPKTVVKKFGPLGVAAEAARWAREMARQTFGGLKRLLTAEVSTE